MPIFLDVSTKIGGIKTLIRSIDISEKTEPEVSEIIAKQHSLLDGCDCILRRAPEFDTAAAVDELVNRTIEKSR